MASVGRQGPIRPGVTRARRQDMTVLVTGASGFIASPGSIVSWGGARLSPLRRVSPER